MKGPAGSTQSNATRDVERWNWATGDGVEHTATRVGKRRPGRRKAAEEEAIGMSGRRERKHRMRRQAGSQLVAGVFSFSQSSSTKQAYEASLAHRRPHLHPRTHQPSALTQPSPDEPLTTPTRPHPPAPYPLAAPGANRQVGPPVPGLNCLLRGLAASVVVVADAVPPTACATICLCTVCDHGD